MKRLSILFLAFMAFLGTYADNEKSSPLEEGTKLERKVNVLDLEGNIYYDVTIFLKATSKAGWVTDIPAVKIRIKDNYGKTIYKKDLKHMYIYTYSGGLVEVKQQHHLIMCIDRPTQDKIIVAELKENGIF